MSPELVRLELIDSIGTLTLMNPPLNILSAAVRPQYCQVLQQVAANRRIRALVITGDGDRSFCAGADMREEEDLSRETVRAFLDEDRRVYDMISALAIPTIAAINGHCMGGGLELALACDIRITSPSAKFCAAGVKIGLVVSTTRMTRLTGPAVAADVILTGRTFTSDEAVRFGLASEAVDDPRKVAFDYASTIAGRAPLAVARAKQAIAEAASLPFEEAFRLELNHFADMAGTSDHKEGLKAFFERRAPRFTGA